jgi:hypothetical protein
MPSKRKSDRTSVFLNVPFDNTYEPLFVALIAALVAIGRRPHCVLELPERGQGRLSRLLDLIETCPVSVHDLSRVGQPVRFNMPFELGFAVARARNRTSRSFVILEKERHRLQRTLSDLNGIDPAIHGGSVRGVLSCVVSSLGKPAGHPDPSQVFRLYRHLSKAVAPLKKSYSRKNIFSRATFNLLVVVASKLAKAQGLLKG